MILHLPLASSTLDPDTAGRMRPRLLEELLAREETQVLLADDVGHIALRDGRLEVLPGPSLAPGHGVLVYLGRDDAGRGHVLAVGSRLPGHSYHDLRTVMHEMAPAERSVAVPAVAMANWHRLHPRCPRCGHETETIAAGWIRHCHTCALDHHPRTDPAVIMAVVDDADRLLLAHAAHFPRGRWSMVAGYVEPGESLERAVAREVREEVGVEVTEVTYRGSQPWPFPRSLMVAFTARVAGRPQPSVDRIEIEAARFFSRAELAEEVRGGRLTLPGPASVARALLEDWFGGPVPAACQ